MGLFTGIIKMHTIEKFTMNGFTTTFKLPQDATVLSVKCEKEQYLRKGDIVLSIRIDKEVVPLIDRTFVIFMHGDPIYIHEDYSYVFQHTTTDLHNEDVFIFEKVKINPHTHSLPADPYAGLSAYEIAVAKGYKGSSDDWLNQFGKRF